MQAIVVGGLQGILVKVMVRLVVGLVFEYSMPKMTVL